MRTALPLMLLVMLFAAPARAQDVRYISDKQYIPLRSGASTEHRITHRGLPSGTRLTVSRESDDGVWAEITTDGDTSGWIRAQYLMKEVPAQVRLDEILKKSAAAGGLVEALQDEVAGLQAERDLLVQQQTEANVQLDTLTDELTQLKQISGNALQLDEDNRRLVVEQEHLRSELDMLASESQRLRDKVENEDFLNGALAVLLGVMITLLVPRLWPKRRKSSSWA